MAFHHLADLSMVAWKLAMSVPRSHLNGGNTLTLRRTAGSVQKMTAGSAQSSLWFMIGARRLILLECWFARFIWGLSMGRI